MSNIFNSIANYFPQKIVIICESHQQLYFLKAALAPFC